MLYSKMVDKKDRIKCGFTGCILLIGLAKIIPTWMLIYPFSDDAAAHNP